MHNINTNMNFSGKAEIIKKVQTALGITADGDDGPKTWNAILSKISPTDISVPIPPTPTAGSDVLSDNTMKLILEHEVGGGESYYSKALKRPTYPGGASGVTIGIGYDLGYNTAEQFDIDWKSRLSADAYSRLAQHLGKKSDVARSAVSLVKDIEISWDSAYAVFKTNTIPRFVKETLRAFPGADGLAPDAFGALVSIVFNRGGSLSGSTRSEMLNISKAIKGEISVGNLYDYIADQVIAMKRLWIGKGLDGLLRRRNEEAAMIRSCK